MILNDKLKRSANGIVETECKAMKESYNRVAAVMLVLILLFCTPTAWAATAGATLVQVNGVTLTSAAPYWANGSSTASTTAPASGGYIFFDAAAETLTLCNAVVGNISAIPGSTTRKSCLFVDGDIHIMLSGASTLSYASDAYATLYGLCVWGKTSIGGDGSLNVQINNTFPSSNSLAIFCRGDLSVISGTLILDVDASISGFGLTSEAAILFAGGNAQIDTNAMQSAGLMTQYSDIRITGGSVTAAVTSSGPYASGLYGSNISLEGGVGRFSANGGTTCCGLGFWGKKLVYTGGTFTFSGSKTAITYDKTFVNYALTAPKGTVNVSLFTDGRNLMPWTSDADGMLISLSKTLFSNFRFVKFCMPVPQTGDTSLPWLWISITLCALTGMAVLTAAAIRERRRRA